MAIDVTVFDADLIAAIADLPATFAWSTYSNIQCTCTQLAEGYNLTLAGNTDEVHFEVIFANSSTVGPNPQVGDRISLTQFGPSTATNYEVLSTEASQDGISITLVVKADHRL